VEWKGCCSGSIEAKAMCIFQKKSEAQMAPIETSMLSSSMREKYKPSSINIVPVEGYEQLYSQLSEAGNRAFSLSAVFGKPNMRTLRRGERHSKQKTVHLVCQKNQGDQNPPSQYLIINCQIIISQHWRSITASIPDLTNFLSSYCTQGHKIASIFNPPLSSDKGTQFHMILSKTVENYYVTVRDVQFTSKNHGGRSETHRTVDHSQYLAAIQAYASQGWELAGLIDMPHAPITYFNTDTVSTVKLIFQSPATNGQPGGIL